MEPGQVSSQFPRGLRTRLLSCRVDHNPCGLRVKISQRERHVRVQETHSLYHTDGAYRMTSPT